MTLLRNATKSDEPEVMRLAYAYLTEAGIHNFAIERIRSLVDRGIRRDDAMLVVTGKPGRLKGALLIAAIDVWYSDTPRLTEVFLYVDPGHRRSANAQELRRFAAACRCRDSSNLSDGTQICAAKQGASGRLTNLPLEPALAHEIVADQPVIGGISSAASGVATVGPVQQ